MVSSAAFTEAAGTAALKVGCDLSWRHGADPDRVDPTSEKSLLEAALVDAAPHFPDELRPIAPQLTFLVDHKHREESKLFYGWSAEDDQDYRYPDREFYPAGTIKVCLGERFIQVLRFFSELSRVNPAADLPARAWQRMVVIHETKHALQYHQKPLRDLHRSPNSIRDGLADPSILDETKRKVDYERDAFALGRKYVKKSELLALAAACDKYIEGHRPEFEAGAKYGLITAEFPAKLRKEAEMVDRGREFSPAQKILLEGQYEVPQVVLDLKALNDDLSSSSVVRSTQGALARFKGLQERWMSFMGPSIKSSLRAAYPYVAEVEKRYHAEEARCVSLLNQAH